MKISVGFIFFMVIFTYSKCNNLNMDIIGKSFGKLTVIEKSQEKKSYTRDVFYLCRCECGKLFTVRGGSLKSGGTKACMRCGRITHGKSKLREHRLWVNMKYRCYGVNGPDYHRYGGRGIKVCERWMNSFEDFFADMGPAPSDKHSIDRKRVNGDYEPGNCRWATRREQSNNTRTNRFITHNGVTRTLVEWSREVGISPETLSARFKKGWTIENALTKPLIDSKFRATFKAP